MSGNNKLIGGGGIHHVAIKASNFDASVRFYTQALGFTPVMAWGEGDGRAVMLDTGDGSCIEVFAGGQRKGDGAWLHLALNSDNPDAALERARNAGMVVTMEPADIPVPSTPPVTVRIAFCKGPDGEIIEFFKKV